MVAYADHLSIHGGSIGDDILYKQMPTALKNTETKAMQLGLKFYPEKCGAIWFRSNDPYCNFRIDGEKFPWREPIKYLGVIIDKIQNFRKQTTKKTDRKMKLLKVLSSISVVNAIILKNIYTPTIQATLEYGAVTLGIMAPSYINMLQVSQNQGMRLFLGVPRGTRAKMMRHELHMLTVKHRELSRVKPYRKNR